MSATQISISLDELNAKHENFLGNLRLLLSESEEKVKKVEETLSVFLNEYNEKKNKLEELSSKLNSLQNEKNGLEDKKSTAVKRRDEIQSEIENLSKESAELEAKISEHQALIVSRERELDSLKEQHGQLNQKISEVNDRLVKAEEEHQSKVGVLKDEATSILDGLRRQEAKYKVLLNLFKSEYLKDPTFDILTRLGQPGITSSKTLALSANAQEQVVIQTLKKLDEHEIVKFDEASGNFTVLKELEV